METLYSLLARSSRSLPDCSEVLVFSGTGGLPGVGEASGLATASEAFLKPVPGPCPWGMALLESLTVVLDVDKFCSIFSICCAVSVSCLMASLLS